jgi:hypothetical protein
MSFTTTTSSSTAPLPPVDPQVLLAAEADLRQEKIRLDGFIADLRLKEARLDQEKTRLDQANSRLDSATSRVKQAEDRRDEAIASKADLEAALVRVGYIVKSTRASNEAIAAARNAVVRLGVVGIVDNPTLDQVRTALDNTIAALNTLVMNENITLNQARPALVQAINEANARVNIQQSVVNSQQQVVATQTERVLFLQGNRVSALEYFNRPFQKRIPAADEKGTNQAKATPSLTRTTMKFYVPNHVRKWDEFNPEVHFVPMLQNKTVNNYPEPQIQASLDDERQVESYFSLPQQNVMNAVCEVFPDSRATEVHTGAVKPEISGRVDKNYYVWSQTFPVVERIPRATIEFKRPQIRFFTDQHPVDTILPMYQERGDERDGKIGARMAVFDGIVQLYSYMVTGKTETFGVLMNWDYTLFVKRIQERNTTNNQLEEVLFISDWFDLNHIRMAHAYFFWLVVNQYNRGEDAPSAPIETLVLPAWYEKFLDDRKREHDAALGNGGGGAATSSSSSSAATTSKGGAKSGKKAAIIQSTQQALGIPPLMFVQQYQMLADTEKAQTRLIQVPKYGQVVGKFVNYLGTPKHTDWSEEALIELEETEIAAYEHLQSLQGIVIPKFIFNGSDFNFFFVTVTSYEGVSLQRLVELDGYLSLNVRLSAMSSLRRIHEAGVLHGDVALRNVVYREVDGMVLWVDLERAYIRKVEDDGMWFENEAKGELEQLDELWRDIPTSPPPKPTTEVAPVAAPPSSNTTSPNVKRSKLSLPCGSSGSSCGKIFPCVGG